MGRFIVVIMTPPRHHHHYHHHTKVVMVVVVVVVLKVQNIEEPTQTVDFPKSDEKSLENF